MSQQNVDLVRTALEAYLAGERDTFLEAMAEDVEIIPDASRFPEASAFTGREEFRRYLADIDQGWDGSAGGVLREVFSSGDRVITRGDWGGKGRASGLDMRTNLSGVYTIRDGLIFRIEYFFDHAQALEAAGRSG